MQNKQLTMSWNDFADYLTENIIKKNEYTSREEYDFADKAVLKFKIPTETKEELLLELHKLLLSHEQRFESRGNYHELPEIEQEEIEETEILEEESDGEGKNSNTQIKTRLKTWKELYPNRDECLLGSASNDEPPSEEAFLLLEKIYQSWLDRENKAEELKKFAEEWEEKSKKLASEWISEQAQKFFKKKGLNTLSELKNWLADYENLSEKQKKKLESKKGEIEDQLELLGVEVEKEKEYKEEKSWFKSLDWKSIFVSTGIGLVAILIIWIIKKYIFG